MNTEFPSRKDISPLNFGRLATITGAIHQEEDHLMSPMIVRDNHMPVIP